MSHEDDDGASILLSIAGKTKINGITEELRKKIEAILERANKEVDKVLEKNPNL